MPVPRPNFDINTGVRELTVDLNEILQYLQAESRLNPPSQQSVAFTKRRVHTEINERRPVEHVKERVKVMIIPS